MTTLLILTVGQSDVQIVIDGLRHELEPKQCGVLHDEIERRGYQLVDVPAKDRQRMEELPKGDLSLCTPKLDAVLRYLEVSSPPSAALIFHTHRTLRSDPRLAGAVLERRLNERGVKNVRRVAFLTGDEKLEDAAMEVDAVVRRSVVATLSNAIGVATANLKPSDGVYVATTGGLPAANELINELVRLHCVSGPGVTALEVADGAFSAQDDRAVPERFHPAAGYRARWQALSLVEKGNLLGAWGAVSHLADESGQEWTKVIHWLQCFAASLPMPDDCDIAVLTHPRMAVRAALRVELALRAGDIPRAVHGTVAFFEAALWDGLNEHIERSEDQERRRYFRFKSGEPPDKLLRSRDDCVEDRKRPFEHKDTIDEVDWYWIYDGDGGPAARIAKYFLKHDALAKFDKALRNDTGALRYDIRALRNDVTHNEPTPKLMDSARAQMQSAKLWSEKDTFLNQDLVQAVLREPDVPCPERLCEDLISTTRSRLLAISDG